MQEAFYFDKMLVGILYQVLLVACLLSSRDYTAAVKLIVLCAKADFKAEIVKLSLYACRIVSNAQFGVMLLYKGFTRAVVHSFSDVIKQLLIDLVWCDLFTARHIRKHIFVEEYLFLTEPKIGAEVVEGKVYALEVIYRVSKNSAAHSAVILKRIDNSRLTDRKPRLMTAWFSLSAHVNFIKIGLYR